MAAGAAAYLCKPVNDEALLDAITGALNLEIRTDRECGKR